MRLITYSGTLLRESAGFSETSSRIYQHKFSHIPENSVRSRDCRLPPRC